MKKIAKLAEPVRSCFSALKSGDRKEKQEAALSLFLWCLFVFVLISTSIYTIWTFRAEFHSDAATAAMIAPFQQKEGALLLDEWYYSQDFWPFFVFNPVLLLKPILQSDYLATQVPVLIQTLLLMLLSMALLGKVYKSKLNILVLSMIFSIGTAVWIGPLFGQGQYGNVILWVLLSIWLTLELLDAKKTWKRYTLLAVTWILVCYINTTSVRYLPFFAIPMLAALIVKMMLAAQREVRRRCLLALCTIASAAVVGYLGFGALCENYHYNPGNTESILISNEQIVQKNISNLVYAFLTLGAGGGGKELVSLDGVYYLYAFFGFCAMALLPVWACTRFFRKKQWEERPNALLLVCFFVTVTFISVICMLMTNLDNTGRYLMVAIYCGFLVLPILLEALEGHMGRKLLACILCVPVIVGGMFKLNEPLGKPIKEDNVIACLKENGLEQGYADFWVADKFTVLSNHEIQIAHINVGDMSPFMFMACPEQYQHTQNDRYFLLLREEDVEAAQNSPIEEYMGSPEEIITCESYQIWVYDQPFYGNMPWTFETEG